MAYCTQADIEKLLTAEGLVQLADDDENGAADVAVVAAAIAHADGVVNAYCQERYEIPLSPVPDIIRECSVDIAIWWLYSRRDIEQPNRKARAEAAEERLKKIATGMLSLGIEDPPGESGDKVESSTEDTDRKFDETTLSNF